MSLFKNAVKASLLLAFLAGTAQAQDIHFAQFYENAALRNPALTGIYTGDYKVGANYRSQWSNLPTPYQTIMASAEARTRLSAATNDYFSYGLTVTYDKAGAISLNTMQIMPTINYNKHLQDENSSYISVGFGAGYIQRSFLPSSVTTNSQYGSNGYDPGLSSGENFANIKLNQFDLGGGVSFNSSIGKARRANYYVGLSAYHITRPKESFMQEDRTFSRLTGKYSAQAGLSVLMTPSFGLTTHFNYTNQHPYQEWIGGGLLSYHYRDAYNSKRNLSLYAGAFYRLNDAIIPTVKIDFRDLAFTASYEVNTNTAAQMLGNTLEFSLFMRGFFPRADRATDQTMCPRFEIGSGAGEAYERNYY